MEIKTFYIPILRSFEGNSEHYVYGYSAIFDSADAFGTVISRNLVERNLPRLKQYPAVRFMHKEPCGKIVFDETVNGISTYTDEHGFHVLVKINSACSKEWSLVKEGGWGFSYGLMPSKTERQKVNGQEVEVFVEGQLYEISLVDSPAHPEAVVQVLRSQEGVERALDEIQKDEERYKAQRQLGFLLEPAWPETCSKECPNTNCSSWGRIEMQGQRCRNLPLTNEELISKATQKLEDTARAFDKFDKRMSALERNVNIDRSSEGMSEEEAKSICKKNPLKYKSPNLPEADQQ